MCFINFLEIRSSPVGDFGFPLTFGQTDQNKPQSVLIWAKIVDEQPLNSVGVDAVSWWETFELPILPCGQLPRLTWPDGPQVDIAKRLILADWFSIFKISDFWKKNLKLFFRCISIQTHKKSNRHNFFQNENFAKKNYTKNRSSLKSSNMQ